MEHSWLKRRQRRATLVGSASSPKQGAPRLLVSAGTTVVEAEVSFSVWHICLPIVGHWHTLSRPTVSSLMQTWLDEGKDITIADDGKGKWTIGVKLKIATSNRELPSSYFPSPTTWQKKALSRALDCWPQTKTWNFNVENARVEVDLQQVNGGFWVPKTSGTGDLDKTMTVTSCDNVEVNPPMAMEHSIVSFQTTSVLKTILENCSM